MNAIQVKTDGCGTSGYFSSAADARLGFAGNKTYAVMSMEIPTGYRLAAALDRKGGVPKGAKILINKRDGLGMRWDISAAYRTVPFPKNYIYIIPTPPKIEVTVLVNGVATQPSTISEETWANLRKA